MADVHPDFLESAGLKEVRQPVPGGQHSGVSPARQFLFTPAQGNVASTAMQFVEVTLGQRHVGHPQGLGITSV
jgi:hypothetical protein